MKIPIKLLPHASKLYPPKYETEGAAGFDLRAAIAQPASIPPMSIGRVPLGFVLALLPGWELQVRPRSGLSFKGIFCQLGTVDPDYRGEVSAILHNTTDKPFVIEPGDRIAQGVICPIVRAEWDVVTGLGETARGANGFGSTGMSDEGPR